MPPVTALRSPPLSRMTGALSPVIGALVDRGDALDDLAVARDDVAGLDEHDVALAQRRGRDRRRRAAPRSARRGFLAGDVPARRAERVGLRLAAPLGHRLGEVGEQHREPEPDRDGEDEAGRRLAACRRALEQSARREDGADLDDEHHRVRGPGGAGRACGTRRRRRAARSRRRTAARVLGVSVMDDASVSIPECQLGADHHEVLDDRAERERRDERQRADEHDDADRAARRTAACASAACRARRHDLLLRQRAGDREHRDDEPVARERASRARARCCRRALLAPRPANALPLLLPAEEKRVEDLAEAVRRRGCRCVAVPPRGAPPRPPSPTSTTAGGIRMTSDAIFISNASIFLPRYSGVRPTISPATNTATMANTSMP